MKLTTNTWVPRCLGHVAPSHSLSSLSCVECPLAQLSTNYLPPISTTGPVTSMFHADVPHHSYKRATCHHCKDDTCHSLTSPLYLYTSMFVRLVILPCVTSRRCHISVDCSCHVRCTDVRPVESPATWHYTDCTVNIFLPVWQNKQIIIN
jgi:hypothetical protein